MVRAIPHRLANGAGNLPDADEYMGNWDWLTAVARGNFLLNGGLEIWELGTSFTNPADATSICNGWTLEKGGTSGATADITRESTTKDTGSYSAKINITGAGSSNSYLRLKQSLSNYLQFAGETVIFGARIRVATASKVRLSITDGVNTAYSSYHTGGGTFEGLYVALACSSSLTSLIMKVEITSDITDAVYIDSAFMYAAPSQISESAKAALGFFPTDDDASSDYAAAVTDGWVPANETWTYASSSTFTISGDKTGKYQIGDKIKLTQTTVKYFYITAISYGAPNTTVTVSGGGTYSVANAAITSPYFSKIRNPQGFPAAWLVGSITGFSQTVDSATFTDTQTKICSVVVALPMTGNVFVTASCDVRGGSGKTFRIFIKRDATTKTSGPFHKLPDADRYANSTSWAESGLAAGSYEFQLYAANTADNAALTVGDVLISVFAYWQ